MATTFGMYRPEQEELTGLPQEEQLRRIEGSALGDDEKREMKMRLGIGGYAPQPTAPVWQSLLVGSGTDVSLPENLTIQDVYNKEYMDKLAERAYMEGPSPWLTQMLEKQQMEESALRDAAAAQTQAGIAQAQSQLAMRGGLRSGAAERLAGQGLRGLMGARQEVGRQGAMARTGLGVTEEEMKIGLMQALPGMELGRAQYASTIQGKNIQNILEEQRLKEAAKQDAYKAQMQAWAAAQEREAVAQSGGKK